MAGYLFHRSKYGSYFKSEHGIKKFAERCVDQLVRKVTKKSAFYREMNENLLVEKSNLRLRLNDLDEQPTLSAGEFFRKRRHLWASNFVMVFFVVGSVFLNFLSVSAFITADTMGAAALRWVTAAVLAVVLTGGGLIVAERLVESLFAKRSELDEKNIRRSTAILWAGLLLVIEIALLGLSEVRASLLAAQVDSGVLYTGYIVLSMMLPLIAGTFRWDAMRFIDVYKTTQALRQIESRLAQIDSVLRQNEEYESNYYKIQSIEYWDLLNEFKTYKDAYNQRKGISEDLRGHFAQSYDHFQGEANKRYKSDIRDITATSIRRLELGDQDRLVERPAMGMKLGQKGDRGAASGDGAGTDYLSPQPIR